MASIASLSPDLIVHIGVNYISQVRDFMSLSLSCKRFHRLLENVWESRYRLDICSQPEGITNYKQEYRRVIKVLNSLYLPTDRGAFVLHEGYDKLAERLIREGLPRELLMSKCRRLYHNSLDQKNMDPTIWITGAQRKVQRTSQPISLPANIFNRMRHLLSGQFVCYNGYYYRLEYGTRFRHLAFRIWKHEPIPYMTVLSSLLVQQLDHGIRATIVNL